MTRPLATILYEDSRGPQRDFGLHALVVAGVADQLGVGYWRTIDARFEARPLGPNSKVLLFVRNTSSLVARDGRAILAVLDDDRVSRLLREHDGELAHPDCRKQLALQFCQGSPARAVFLVKNMETVVRAAGTMLGRPAERIAEAVRSKDHTLRDNFLHAAAEAEPRIRAAVLDQVPSLQRLVTMLALLQRPA